MIDYLYVQISAQLFSLFTAIYSYRKKSVSGSGLGAMLIVSSIFIWLWLIPQLVILFLMFASSSLLTMYKKEHKQEINEIVEKKGPRDYIQAICNLGVAFLLGLIYYLNNSEAILVAFCSAVAAANGDSWASEIGGLSKEKPVMITNLKPVEKGISGGITLIGTFGGVAGSLFIAAFSIMLLQNIASLQTFLIITFAGVVGLLFDSYIGALFQSAFKDSEGKIIEYSPCRERPVKGFAWINNDMVNLLTTIFAAAAGWTIYALFLV
ncbi:MAG: DUF92 domain-containing protein [Cytophagaceae bacterium]